MTRSEQLFALAQQLIPGGVNSPVRAFGSVGGTPRFIQEAKGSSIKDVDGNQYIDFVGSWGPMILGHNHPEICNAVIETAKKGDSFDLGLPDGNTGFYKNDVGARSLGIYVGNIGQYGLIRKAIFSGMLRDIEAQSDDVTTADTNNDKANLQIHQEVNSHLKFAGIEIDGSLATFRSKLIEKGYKPTDSHENILQGNFAGYECDIFIYCVEGADLVHMVIASTKPEESWDRLYIKYLSLVELYSKKYGSPSNSVNKFEYPFDGTTDMQMTAVKTDHAHFMTMWNTPNGDIMISISKEGTIAIYYTDKINSAQHEVLKEQRIIDEI